MAWKIVAYDGSPHPIWVPTRLICDDGSLFALTKAEPGVIRRVTENDVWDEISQRKLERTMSDTPMGPGLWIAVEGEELSSFPLAGEEVWRAKKAEELVERFRSPGGNPLQKLQVLQAAGALVGLDVTTLMRRLSSAKRDGETIEQAWERLKNE